MKSVGLPVLSKTGYYFNMKSKVGRCVKPTDNILSKWDASITPEMAHKLAMLEQRRRFLTGMLKSSAALGTLPLWGILQACAWQTEKQSFLQQHPWQTFSMVQEHLFPADGNGPSAREINASVYLKFVLDAPDTDADDKTFILKGIEWLDGLSKEQFGQPFMALNVLDQNKALKKIAGSAAGERWLSHLVLYILEALLTAPAYGGNPDGIGWQWLEHQAGFPQPSKDKRYTELL